VSHQEGRKKELPVPRIESALLAFAVSILLLRATVPAQLPPVCAGDCNDDGTVTVDELVVAVQIALDLRPIAACRGIDRTFPLGRITITDLQIAVRSFLEGCPRIECGDGVAEGEEECDGEDTGNCPGLCTTECACPTPVCGNGIVEAGEICDGEQFNEDAALAYRLASRTPLTCVDCEPRGFFTSYCRFVPCSGGAHCVIFGPNDVGYCSTIDGFLEWLEEICATDPFTCEQIRRICWSQTGCIF
jgi:hypothetical protein